MMHELEIGRAEAAANVCIRPDGLYVATAACDGIVAKSRPMSTPTSALHNAIERLQEARPDVGRAFVEYAELGDDYEVNLVGCIIYGSSAGGAF